MTTIKKINAKQTKITLSDGLRFKAQEDINGNCEGCSFNILNVQCPMDQAGNLMCSSGTRKDGISMVWRERKVKPPKPLPSL